MIKAEVGDTIALGNSACTCGIDIDIYRYIKTYFFSNFKNMLTQELSYTVNLCSDKITLRQVLLGKRMEAGLSHMHP